jgi:hypothetical protein
MAGISFVRGGSRQAKSGSYLEKFMRIGSKSNQRNYNNAYLFFPVVLFFCAIGLCDFVFIYKDILGMGWFGLNLISMVIIGYYVRRWWGKGRLLLHLVRGGDPF